MKKEEVIDFLKANIEPECIVNCSNIIKIKKSPNAIPKELLKQIDGETLMSWTGFVLKMKDGKLFNYGTSYSLDFFELPKNYSFSDVQEVINHSFADENGEIKEYRKVGIRSFPDVRIYREIDYFDCYVEGL